MQQVLRVTCQNCGLPLAAKDNGKISYNPDKIISMTHTLDKGNTLLTLQCPKCGCTVQTKV